GAAVGIGGAPVSHERMLLSRQQPTVDGQHDAVNVAAGVARKEYERWRQLFDPAGALHRYAAVHHLGEIVGRELIGHLGREVAGSEGIDTDPFASAPLLGQLPRKPDDGRLGVAVCRLREAAVGREAEDAADVYYR